MASGLAFLRKSPSENRRKYLESIGINAPDDFNWTSKGRLKEFIAAVVGLIELLPDEKHEAINGDLAFLGRLADNNCMLAAKSVCAGAKIDLYGLEGVEHILLFLALNHRQQLERIATKVSMSRQYGGKYWASYQITGDKPEWQINSPQAREAFIKATTAILNLSKDKRHEANWFTTIHTDEYSGKKVKLIHANIYIEDKSENLLGFGSSNCIERQLVSRVAEIGIICNTKDQTINIFSKERKDIQQAFADTFKDKFAPNSDILI